MADNQDPLAALQKLLEDQKKSASPAGADPSLSAGLGVDTNAPASPPAGPSAEEILALQKQREAEDQVKIAEQLARMQSELKNTPQYQARMSQKENNEVEAEKKRLEERSQRIFQLKHLDP